MNNYIPLAMPSATPGVGECHICFEIVPCVKELDCGHVLCIPCLNRIVHDQAGVRQGVVCPECRQITDCSKGVQFLPTRFFGKIKCDLCLNQKEAEDMWWCPECVQAVCSKCNIKEHSKKGHHTAEWNKYEPVQFSLSYIEDVRQARQDSTGAIHNRHAIRQFLDEVDDSLQRQLALHPELQQLKETVLQHYGRRFSFSQCSKEKASQAMKLIRSQSKESGPKVVAKVLQLAGANILEALIPQSDHQAFQIHFTEKPEEIAKYLASKIEFIPYDSEASEAVEGVYGPGDSKKSEESASPIGNRRESHIDEEINFAVPEELSIPFGDIDFLPSIGIFVLQTDAAVFLHNIRTTQNHISRAQPGTAFRSVCFVRQSQTSELLVAIQSLIKKHCWTLEGWNINQLPYTTLYSTELDIDPEDRVVDLFVSVIDPNVIYEIRLIQGLVSEIWRATFADKKTKVKLKEQLLYQRPNSKYTAVQAIETGSKDRILIVYDELSKTIQRLIVKGTKCEAANKIMNTDSLLPFHIGPAHRLWVFDPDIMSLCVSTAPVSSKTPVTFRRICGYQQHKVDGVWYGSETKIWAASIDELGVTLVAFRATTNDDNQGISKRN